jgi:hypothetical protein
MLQAKQKPLSGRIADYMSNTSIRVLQAKQKPLSGRIADYMSNTSIRVLWRWSITPSVGHAKEDSIP